MSNWADFAISAVKRGPGLGQISQIQIHEDKGEEFGPPMIVDKQLVASEAVSYTHLTLPTKA